MKTLILLDKLLGGGAFIVDTIKWRKGNELSK
jgi:hypothetical protein